MKKTLLLFSIISIILTSCGGSYRFSPKADLEKSPIKISKRIKFEKLIDSANKPEDGFSKQYITKEPFFLDANQTTKDAIINTFNNNLFVEFGENIENPDYKAKVIINKYEGGFDATTYSKFALISSMIGVTTAIAISSTTPLVLMLPLVSDASLLIPTIEYFAEIEIVLNIYDRNDNLVGTYKGMSKQYEKGFNDYYSIERAGENTNIALSKTLEQIQNEILKDIKLK